MLVYPGLEIAWQPLLIHCCDSGSQLVARFLECGCVPLVTVENFAQPLNGLLADRWYSNTPEAEAEFVSDLSPLHNHQVGLGLGLKYIRAPLKRHSRPWRIYLQYLYQFCGHCQIIHKGSDEGLSHI